MTATSRAPRRPRIRPRGPPPAPTPIRTARGASSAAADERVLAEFLEASLRVPDLSLPPRKRFNFPPAPPPESDGISSHALVSGDADAALRAVAAAAESGAFRVTDAREVRDALESASWAVFAAPEEVKRDLGRWWFRRRDRAPGEDFFWFRPMSADEDRAMDAALPASTYRASFRQKMDTLASKMEDIAKAVIRVLSDNVKNPEASARFREAPSILCLTLYNSNMSETCCNDFGRASTTNSHALSIHLCGVDRRVCLRNQGGSTFSSLPTGSMLVTIGRQIQEWSNGQFKTAVGEVLFEMTDEADPFISVELMYSPDDLHLSELGWHASRTGRPKVVSFRDQIRIALILLSLFYIFWC